MTGAERRIHRQARLSRPVGVDHRARDIPYQAFSHYALRVEKSDGKPITEEGIKARADEAERGYDIERLRKRGRRPLGDGPTHIVPVRIDDDLLAALTERADHDHVSRSEAIREAIRSYVT